MDSLPEFGSVIGLFVALLVVVTWRQSNEFSFKFMKLVLIFVLIGQLVTLMTVSINIHKLKEQVKQLQPTTTQIIEEQ